MNEKAKPTRRAVLQGILIATTLATTAYVTTEPAEVTLRKAKDENKESEGRRRVPVGLL